jgi:hypothetical protein
MTVPIDAPRRLARQLVTLARLAAEYEEDQALLVEALDRILKDPLVEDGPEEACERRLYDLVRDHLAECRGAWALARDAHLATAQARLSRAVKLLDGLFKAGLDEHRRRQQPTPAAEVPTGPPAAEGSAP